MSELRILHVIESLGRAGAEQALVNVLPLMLETHRRVIENGDHHGEYLNGLHPWAGFSS